MPKTGAQGGLPTACTVGAKGLLAVAGARTVYDKAPPHDVFLWSGADSVAPDAPPAPLRGLAAGYLKLGATSIAASYNGKLVAASDGAYSKPKPLSAAAQAKADEARRKAREKAEKRGEAFDDTPPPDPAPVVIWHVGDGSMYRALGEPPSHGASRCVFSRDDEYVAASCGVEGVHVWQVSSGKLVHSFPLAKQTYGAKIDGLVWTPDNRIAFSAERSMWLYDWKPIADKLRAGSKPQAGSRAKFARAPVTLDHDDIVPKGVIVSVAACSSVTGAEASMAVGFDNGMLAFWKYSRVCLGGIRRYGVARVTPATACAYTEDATMVATAHSDSIRIWDGTADTSTLLHTIKCGSPQVRSLGWCPGTYVLAIPLPKSHSVRVVEVTRKDKGGKKVAKTASSRRVMPAGGSKHASSASSIQVGVNPHAAGGASATAGAGAGSRS